MLPKCTPLTAPPRARASVRAGEHLPWGCLGPGYAKAEARGVPLACTVAAAAELGRRFVGTRLISGLPGAFAVLPLDPQPRDHVVVRHAARRATPRALRRALARARESSPPLGGPLARRVVRCALLCALLCPPATYAAAARVQRGVAIYLNGVAQGPALATRRVAVAGGAVAERAFTTRPAAAGAVLLEMTCVRAPSRSCVLLCAALC